MTRANAAVEIRPRVRRAGAGRLEIEHDAAGGSLQTTLLAWLSDHPDIVAIRRDDGRSVIEVRYRERDADPGALWRSLRERLFALENPGSPALRVAVAHAVRGRVRLRLDGVAEADLGRLAAFASGLRGVTSARAAGAAASLLVEFDPLATSDGAIAIAIAASDPHEWPAPAARAEPLDTWPVVCNSALLVGAATGLLPVPLATAGVAVAALPCARRTLHALGERRLSVDFLDLSAIAISAATGDPVTAAFMTWLLGIGDLVLSHTSARARVAISSLLDMDVQEAWRVRDGDVELVRVADLAVGDRIIVDAGASIAADGRVASGVAVVDEKALTGESMPRDKAAGDRVLAATVVVEGQLIVEVERTGESTTAARIVQILEGVGAKPMTLQREIERRADWLVPPTIAVACAAGAFSGQLRRTTSVLITDFGTGIRIAVPTSALATMTEAAREGVLVKGGHYLERLASADVVVFDKTGTLTCGEPRIVRVEPLGALSPDELVGLAAAAEARQKHPIAEAIRRCARDRGTLVATAELGSESYTIGVGLSARVGGRAVLVGGARLMLAQGVFRGGPPDAEEPLRRAGISPLFVAVDGRLEGILGYADDPRPESASVVRALRAGGRRELILMSGDSRAAVEATTRALGIDRAMAELLPEDKARAVRELQDAGKTVAMVGDGINDAPALALADVGISLDGATDVALEVADVVLLSGGLENLPRAFAIADLAMARVRRGVSLVVAPNVAAMMLGALGLLSPGGAATINNGSTIVAAVAGLAPLFRSKPRRRPGPSARR